MNNKIIEMARTCALNLRGKTFHYDANQLEPLAQIIAAFMQKIVDELETDNKRLLEAARFYFKADKETFDKDLGYRAAVALDLVSDTLRRQREAEIEKDKTDA